MTPTPVIASGSNPGTRLTGGSRTNAYRLVCSEIWGGIGALDQDVATRGIAASIYAVAAGGNRGGDIHYLSYCSYDMITRIAVADVRGHGESVTLVSSWVYDALKAQMNTVAGNQVLSDLNRKICERGFEAMTTAAVVSYDTSRSALHFCYAGHPPAMVWRHGAGWRRLENLAEPEASNLPLGVRASAAYEQGQVTLTAGDRVVMFTDGLLEAEDLHGDAFGEERLLTVLEEQHGASISAIKYAILDSLFNHTKRLPLVDDLTVLTTEVR
ncbi:MAG: PP2C family protein-serine/threonine phosphatase [Nitrospirota bacterium]